VADDLTPCAFGDPSCPCQDGDPCHYVQHGDSPPMVPPPRDLAPAELLAATAADMRAVADAIGPGAAGQWTANLEAGDGYCTVESADYSHSFGAHMQVVAEHVAAWDPTMARAVADWLDAVLVGHHQPPESCDTVPCRELERALPVCEAWWASRYRDPEAAGRG
jgi:hypothetical protein